MGSVANVRNPSPLGLLIKLVTPVQLVTPANPVNLYLGPLR